MFSVARRLLGQVSVSEKGNEIFVEGIPADVIQNNIKRIWGTSRVNVHMFNRTGSSKFSFNKFFAIEMVYMLQTIHDKSSLIRQRVIDKIITELMENTWLANTLREDLPAPLDLSKLNQLQVRMYDSQDRFLAAYNDIVPAYGLKGYMLAAPPGTGKTITAIALSVCCDSEITFVVSPNNATHEVWETDIIKAVKKPGKIWFSDSGQTPPTDARWYVCHYEGLAKLVDNIRQFRGRKINLILDECHNFNDPDSVRTNHLVRLCKELDIKDILFQSGTPWKAMASELIPFLRCVDPLFDENSEGRFRKIFGVSVARAVDIVSHRIGIISFKIDKSEVVKGAPEDKDVLVKIPNPTPFLLESIKQEMKTYITQRLKYFSDNKTKYLDQYWKVIEQHKAMLRTPAEKQEFDKYQRIAKMISNTYDLYQLGAEMKFCNNYEKRVIMPPLSPLGKKEFHEAKSVYKYVHLKVRGEVLGRIVGKRRMQVQLEMIPHSGIPNIIDLAESKTLIFTDYVEVVDATFDYLSGLGYQPLKVYGETNHDLADIRKRFTDDPKINPVIATYKSLSTAVPMIMANTEILTNQPFRAYLREQAVSRVFRNGQPFQTYIWNTLLDTGKEPNISTRSKDILEWSKDQVEMMLGTKTTVSTESLLDEVDDDSSELYFNSDDAGIALTAPSMSW